MKRIKQLCDKSLPYLFCITFFTACVQLNTSAGRLQNDTDYLLEEQLHDGEIAAWRIPEDPDIERNLAVFLTCTEEQKLCRYYYTVLNIRGKNRSKVFGRSCRNYKNSWEAVSWDIKHDPAMHRRIKSRYFELLGLNKNAPPANYVSNYHLPSVLSKNVTRAERKHRLPLKKMIDKAAKKNHVHPVLIHAMVNTESSYNPKARSHVGAVGLMQLMPATAGDLGVNPRIPRQNLDGGSRYIRQQLDKPGIKGNVALALASYNAGYGNVRKHGYHVPPFKETKNYVKKIMTLYTAQ